MPKLSSNGLAFNFFNPLVFYFYLDILYLFSSDEGSYPHKITSVVFEDGSKCRTIGEYAFLSCTELESLMIPEKISSIGTGAFNGCANLARIDFNAVQMNDLTRGTCIFNDAGNEGAGTTVSVGKNVTRIPAYLFYSSPNTSYLVKVKNVIFESESKCEEIGGYAFYHCIRLNSVTIPDSVTLIKDNAFSQCFSLVEVINNSNLEITAGTTEHGGIANYAISVRKNDDVSNITEEDVYLFYNDGGSYYLMAIWEMTPKLHDTEITLPTEINGNGYDIFANAFRKQNFTSVTIPAKVTSIDDNAFAKCASLASVKFEAGSKCKSIGNYAFSECSILEAFALPEALETIGEHAFYLCNSFKTVTIVSSATQISANAFRNAGLTSATFEESDGWYILEAPEATGGTSLNVSDASANASNLTGARYDGWYFCRK